jgi:hypothetical protein
MSTGQVVRSVTDRPTATERAIMTDSHCTLIMKSLAPSPGRKASQRDWSAGHATPEPEVVSVRRLPPGTANPSNRIEQGWRSHGHDHPRPAVAGKRVARSSYDVGARSDASRLSGKRHRPPDLHLYPPGNYYSVPAPIRDSSTVELFKKVVVSDFKLGSSGLVGMVPNRPRYWHPPGRSKQHISDSKKGKP